jgi:transposase
MIDKSISNKSFSIGLLEFVKKYYKKLELTDVIGTLKCKGIELDKLVRGMITFKLNHNLSISKCGDWMNQLHILRQFQLTKFNTKALYRALETIGQNEALVLRKFQDKLFSKYEFEHTDTNIDWSSLILHGTASPIGAHGYSSDKRPDKEQITFGVGEIAKPVNVPFVLTTQKGNVASKTHFKPSFLRAVKHLKEESLIIIDRGANTKQNKDLMREKLMHYLTARILSGKDNDLLSQFSKLKAEKLSIEKKNGNTDEVYCQKIEQNGVFLYVCFSDKLYEKEITKKQKKIEKDIELIQRLNEKIRAGEKLKIKQKQINLPDKVLTQKITIQDKLVTQTTDQIKKYLESIHVNGREGFYILESSKNLTPKEAVSAYKGKDSIEKIMNSLKNEIEIKPVRVWTESSIRGVVIIGFLTQVFISLARFESDILKLLSTTTILNSLKNLTLTIKKPISGLIEQIISNIDQISTLILPNLSANPG